MTSENQKEQALRQALRKQRERREKAQRERRSLLADTVQVGTLGLVFVLPVVGGAYLGNWLDGLSGGYSLRWTLSLIIAGVALGVVNVVLNLRK